MSEFRRVIGGVTSDERSCGLHEMLAVRQQVSSIFMKLFLMFLLQDVTKAKQFLPFLQRAGRCEAVAEFVASGSRLRLYLPRETCLITFLLSGKQKDC